MNEVEKYSAELLSSAQTHLNRCLVKSSGKELHALRVQIKKIHALLHLLAYCYQLPYQENKALKKLFKRAGKIRNLQLTMFRLEKQVKPKRKCSKNLLAELKGELDSRINRFEKHYKHHKDKAFKKTAELVHECVRMKIKKETALYFRMMKEKINRAVRQRNRNQKQTHQLRKDIKTLKYNLALSVNTDSKFLTEEKLLNKMEKLLGEWHDAVQMASRLKKLKSKLKSKAQSDLQRIGLSYADRSKFLLKKFRQLQPV